MEKQNIKRVAVIGAGLMGYGIAAEFARFGYQVSIYNRTDDARNRTMRQAREDLNLMAEMELLTPDEAGAAYNRLRPTTDLEEAASGADYVVESAPEILPLKQEIFSKLDAICPPPAILATNTSGLLVTDIASTARHPERILATHYFQPPHFIPLVEVSGGEKTERGAIEEVAELLKGMRKKVVIIDVEIPGFVGNRIQGAIVQQARSLVDKGVCSPQTIDDVIMFGFGRRMAYTGCFKRLDLVGLDSYLERQTARGNEPWSPVLERVKRGELGMKSGKGFYDWPGDAPEKFHRLQNTELIRLMKRDMDEGRI